MTDTKYAKQKGGRGHYAYCKINSHATNEPLSFVTDKCTWDALKSTYTNAIVGIGFLDWKQIVINGMQSAISHINFTVQREFELIDVDGHIAHSDNATMFAVGFLSVFNELELILKSEDLEVIDNLVWTSGNLSEAIFDSSIKFEFYYSAPRREI